MARQISRIYNPDEIKVVKSNFTDISILAGARHMLKTLSGLGFYFFLRTIKAMEQPTPVVDLPNVITDIIFKYYYAPKIISIPSDRGQICALLPDGALHRWEAESYVGNMHGIRDIISNGRACAAVTWDDDIITWGDERHGGKLSLKAHTAIADARSKGGSVTKVQSIPGGAFCALFSNGCVAVWGVTALGWTDVKNLEGAIDVCGNGDGPAFAALMPDGTVRTCGNPFCGGDSSSVFDQLKNVVEICSTVSAFAARRHDGTIVTWGNPIYGGSMKNVSGGVSKEPSQVVKIYNTATAFAALRKDGTVITWGGVLTGGDSSGVAELLKDVESVYTTPSGFAALRKDKRVVSWGYWAPVVRATGVVQLCATSIHFTALTDDGRVVRWAGPSNETTRQTLPGVVRSVCADSMSDISLARMDGRTVVWTSETGVYLYTTAGNTPFTEVVSTGTTVPHESSYAAIDTLGDIITWGGGINDNSLQTVHGVVWPGHDCGIQRVLVDNKTSIKGQFDRAFGHSNTNKKDNRDRTLKYGAMARDSATF